VRLADRQSQIVIVDDDASILRAFSKQVALMGHAVTTFQNAADALLHVRGQGADCILLDLNMPGLSGLELQKALTELSTPLPVIFISGAANVQTSVAAMRGGASHFLEKPIEFDDLKLAISEALETGAKTAQETESINECKRRYASLTPRQQAVFAELMTGASNKVIAARLEIGERTVKAHRHALMERLEARNTADILKIGFVLGIADPSPTGASEDN